MNAARLAGDLARFEHQAAALAEDYRQLLGCLGEVEGCERYAALIAEGVKANNGLARSWRAQREAGGSV